MSPVAVSFKVKDTFALLQQCYLRNVQMEYASNGHTTPLSSGNTEKYMRAPGRSLFPLHYLGTINQAERRNQFIRDTIFKGFSALINNIFLWEEQ